MCRSKLKLFPVAHTQRHLPRNTLSTMTSITLQNNLQTLIKHSTPLVHTWCIMNPFSSVQSIRFTVRDPSRWSVASSVVLWNNFIIHLNCVKSFRRLLTHIMILPISIKTDDLIYSSNPTGPKSTWLVFNLGQLVKRSYSGLATIATTNAYMGNKKIYWYPTFKYFSVT